MGVFTLGLTIRLLYLLAVQQYGLANSALIWRSERSDVLFHALPSGAACVSADLFKNLVNCFSWRICVKVHRMTTTHPSRG